MKLTLLTYVRSEEDDPLGPIPLDIYPLYYLLQGFFPCLLLLRRIILKEWGSNPTQRLKFWPPHITFSINFLIMTKFLNLVETWSTCFIFYFLFFIKWTLDIFIKKLRRCFFREFQLMTSAPDDNSLSSN